MVLVSCAISPQAFDPPASTRAPPAGLDCEPPWASQRRAAVSVGAPAGVATFAADGERMTYRVRLKKKKKEWKGSCPDRKHFLEFNRW